MTDGGMKKWTEEEKDQFIYQVIGQFVAGGAKIDYNKLSFPNRTKKALENQWEKLRQKSMAAIGAGGKATKSAANDSSPAAKNGFATPVKGKRTARAADGADDAGSPVIPAPAKRQRRMARPSGKSKGAQTQPAGDDEDEANLKVKNGDENQSIVLKFEAHSDEGEI